MGKYIQQLDLENALSPSTVVAIFTDPGSGVVNVEAIADIIDQAEGEVDGFLITVIAVGSPNLNRFDRLLRRCALDFAMCFSFEKHPEYVKTFGDDPRSFALYKRAKDRMERIQSAVQELPDQPTLGPPANVGALIMSSGPRMIVNSPDGTQNGAGF